MASRRSIQTTTKAIVEDHRADVDERVVVVERVTIIDERVGATLEGLAETNKKYTMIEEEIKLITR